MTIQERRCALICLVVLALAAPVAGLGQAAANAVRPHAGMLRFPAASSTQIAFCYAGRLWCVPREGGLANPVATGGASVMLPRFSPDGKSIAFTGNYDGNRDIYVVPIDGGVPERVTHHPSAELMSQWLPDGRLLFSAHEQEGLGRQRGLYTVSATGGLPQRLPVPYGEAADISADGKLLAYCPNTTDFANWKRYRGGMQSDIWVFDLETKKAKRITDWEGTDTAPMWQGTKVYYLSDNGAEHHLNIWVYDTATGSRAQVTRFKDFDVKWPSKGPGAKGGGEIVFQHGADLCLLDLAANKTRVLDVRIPGDRPNLRPRLVDFSRYIANWSISPSGKRAAVEARGDIWSLPAKDGVPRDITRTSGAAERDPAWSPDGKWIAYFSDASGEYELYISQSDGRGETRRLTHDGTNFRYSPTWSPDSKTIAFGEQTGSIYLCTVATGAIKLVDTDLWGGVPGVTWSHDSRWLAYSRPDSRPSQNAIWLYDVEKGQKHKATSGMFSDGSPVFDRKGDYLYYVSARNFRPLYEDFGTTWIYNGSQVLMAAPLRADIPSPYLPKANEETWQKDEKPAPKPAASVEMAVDSVVAAADPVTGTWNGTATGSAIPGGSMSFKAVLKMASDNVVTGTIETAQGAIAVSGKYNPASGEMTASLEVGPGTTLMLSVHIAGGTATGTGTVAGQVVQIRMDREGGAAPAQTPAAPGKPAAAPVADASKPREKVTVDLDGFEARAMQLAPRPGSFGRLAVNDRNQLIYVREAAAGTDEATSIKLFDIADDKKEEKTVTTGGAFDISADGKKLLVVRGASGTIQDASAGSSGDPVVTSGMTALVEPRAEWKQIFVDAWRLERQFFYAPNMHGLDWSAIRAEYLPMLDDCASRTDVGYVIGEIIGELNVGHAYYGGGDTDPEPAVSVGMLGVDFALVDGAYKIAKIYKGAAWDADARGPLGLPGTKVREGDFLLAVNGVPVDAKQDPWAAFVGLAGKTVDLTVSSKPKMDGDARDVMVSLAGDEGTVRYRAWIERNRAYVDQKTGGRIGYIYVPDTGVNGQNELMRQLVGQRGKDALIVDERWNGGGQVPNRFVELLNRPTTNYWTGRYGNPSPWPPDAANGPKCMLINGMAGSGGDLFPWIFRHEKVGKLIGTRTWGGVVGIGGIPPLIDGASVTAPNFAFFENEKKWGVEGHGVDPDLEVLDDPGLMVNGGDPQLDAGIKLLMDQVKDKPWRPIQRPPYPNRSGMGVPPGER